MKDSSVCQVSSVSIATRYGVGVRGSNPGFGEIFRTRPDRPWTPPSLLFTGCRVSFPRVSDLGVALITHTHLVPRLKEEESYTSTRIWAIMACSRVKFRFYRGCFWNRVLWTYIICYVCTYLPAGYKHEKYS